MRGSSSLPQLAPAKVNGAASDALAPSASPFSTLAHMNARDQRSKGDANALDAPAATSERDGSRRSSSYWANKFQTQSKADFVRGDVAPLLERFEDTALYRHPQRKSLQTVLDEMSAQAGSVSSKKVVGDSKLSVLRRQASDLMVIHRQYRQNSLADATKALIKKSCHERIKASALEPPPKVVPTRFLFDGTRCARASRCDYCQHTGGELECATCNVVAHARCYLSAYEREDRKTRLTFVVPTTAATKSPFSSWLCCHCQSDLMTEYDERSADARAAHLAAQRQVLANALTAYVRMARDASTFAAKKASIIRIQAILRGRQARQRFERLQRMRLKPYAIDALHARAYFPSGVASLAEGLGLGISSSASLEELRLGNGFSCNPFLYVTVVAGNDDDAQLFCFETSVRKPSAMTGAELLDIAWPEKMFVPGADGNATFCFTLLSKNGPNTFFLGQAVLRLLDTGDCWRTGLTTELELLDHVEIFPKTAQHQPLALADAGGKAPKFLEDLDEDDVNSGAKGKPRWVVSINLRPFGEQFSHCGYLNMKSTLESFHTSARWCVLADGVLRIYRHYGVTLASDVVDMARATEVRVVPIASMMHRTASGKSKKLNLPLHSDDNGAGTHPKLAERCCLAVNHLSRLYLFQCERNEQLREWLKKLQGAQKFNSQTSQAHSSAAATTASTLVC